MAYLNPEQGAIREGEIPPMEPAAANANVANANADATYGQPEADLINELKTQFNSLQAKLRTAGFLDT